MICPSVHWQHFSWIQAFILVLHRSGFDTGVCAQHPVCGSQSLWFSEKSHSILCQLFIYFKFIILSFAESTALSCRKTAINVVIVLLLLKLCKNIDEHFRLFKNAIHAALYLFHSLKFWSLQLRVFSVNVTKH